MRILARIVGYTFHYKRYLFLAYFSTVGFAAFALALPWLLGTAIDKVFNTDGSSVLTTLFTLSIAILAVNVLRGVSAYGQQFYGEAVSQRVAYELRNAFYDHLQHLSFAYHDSEQTGNLMSKATVDVEGIRRFIQAGMIRGAYTFLLLVSVSVLLAFLDWKLALVSLIFVPPLIWRGVTVMSQLRESWRAVQAEMGHMTTVLQENLAGQRVVKAFGAEEYEEEKFHGRAGNVAYHSYEASKLEAYNTASMSLFYIGATGLILWIGGREVIGGNLTVGELAQFVFYLGLLAIPVRNMAWVVNSFARGISGGERLFAVLDARSVVQERPDAKPMSDVQGHVVFDDVSFGYDPASPILKRVSFEARPKQVIAMLGAPGSGKTSVVNLLPRFYDVTEGRVTIDGIDVRDTTLASLRSSVGIVQQDVFLFTASIRDNIAYGATDATDEQVIEAAKVAQLHDHIISMPQGYNTWVGERGQTLSGGQRQRLAIARTLLLDPPILILDDSTSSVDTETEHRIRQAMTEVVRGRTTFVIAHRLSTLKDADLILVLDRGEIVQRGTHDELVSQPGPYRRIYELQFLPQEGGSTNGYDAMEPGQGWSMTPAVSPAGGSE
jgi:ATP-binding cassette subfamily B protein